MKERKDLLRDIRLEGLEVAPAQLWGGIRLVPLLRPEVAGDLRLSHRAYHEDLTLVAVGGPSQDPDCVYASFVPHGLVLTWTDDGSPVSAFGTQIRRRDGRRVDTPFVSIRIAHRMARRENHRRLRLLPLHLAMEGFLTHYFGGPDIAWSEYSRAALRDGLSPRFETSRPGSEIEGFEDALRVFEIHEGQVGVLIFVAEALASAFVVPHPDDYRALHRSLIEDFYGELLYHYSRLPALKPAWANIDDKNVDSLEDLRRALELMHEDWKSFHGLMAAGLINRPVEATPVARTGPFLLQRFATTLDPRQENHIGEAIVRSDGRLEYLKTYRLSAAQTRRAYILSRLAEHNWNLDVTAQVFNQSREEFVLRLEKAGFGYLLKEDVIRAARRRR